MNNQVSLQINLAPSDYLHAKEILKHQLRALSTQVDEILLIVDTRASKGRFGEGWDQNKKKLYSFLTSEIQPAFSVRILAVDYSNRTKSKVAQFFFGRDSIPDKDFRGGPFYAYFYGIFHAKNNFVFHLDSDILLGGKSCVWVKEALNYFNKLKDCFIISPLPGPPHPEQKLIGQFGVKKLPNADYAFEISGMSTRLFLLNKRIFEKLKLKLHKPSIRNQIKAIVERNSNADLPEHIISRFMEKHQLRRIDFLGRNPGLWSLHPPYRTKEFYEILPILIRRVERNDLPEDQKGFYDITDSVCNWDEARQKIKRNRWWKRILKK